MRLIDADAMLMKDTPFKVSGIKNKMIQAVLTEWVNSQPTVCDIDQIRDEIERLHYHPKLDFIKNDEVVEMALDIIDRYTKGGKK